MKYQCVEEHLVETRNCGIAKKAKLVHKYFNKKTLIDLNKILDIKKGQFSPDFHISHVKKSEESKKKTIIKLMTQNKLVCIVS